MITLAVTFFLQTVQPKLRVSAAIGAPLDGIIRTIGPGGKARRAPGYVFSAKGFTDIWVDNVGKDMKKLVFAFDKLYTPSEAMKALGLSTKGMVVSPIALSNVPIMLTRNKCALSGIGGLPPSWKAGYEETAVANADRTRELKPQIDSASGEVRIRLIKECYDWYSHVEISR